MDSLNIIADGNGNWNAEDIAYIWDIHWNANVLSSLQLIVLLQSKIKAIPWPSRNEPFFKAVIHFENVRNLHIRNFGNGPQQVMGFSINDISNNQMEGISYHVEDYEHGIIDFYAESFIVLSVDRYTAESDLLIREIRY